MRKKSRRNSVASAFKMRGIKGWIALFVAVFMSLFVVVMNIARIGSADEGASVFFKVTDVLDEADPVTGGASSDAEEVMFDGASDGGTALEEILPMEYESEDGATNPSGGGAMVLLDSAEGTDGVEVLGTAEETYTGPWHFYNLDLQNNGRAEDDYDFGRNPILTSDVALKNLADLIDRKQLTDSITVSEIAEVVDAREIDQELRSRMREDPALGAADMAWFDSILGTRYLGVFYSEAEEKWDAAMNAAKEAWMADADAYNRTLDAFFKYLDSATGVEVKRVSSGLTDQMYMNPYTMDGVPDVVVMETTEHNGWFLVYTFTIKGTTKKEVKYRLDCGFQPTNVAEIMNVTPQKNPNNKTNKVNTSGGGGSDGTSKGSSVQTQVSGGGGSGGGGNSGGGGGNTPIPTPTPGPGPNPTPTPTPVPGPIKDPTKGTQVLPNDDPGPGTDTNGDPNWSSMELPTNSAHMTLPEYQQAIQELQQINEASHSQEGSAPNTPSYTPPDSGGSGGSTPHVDNNGDSGTGNGGISVATPVQPSSVSNDPAGSSWDGPPDA